ncbi:hypothetical protein Dimus_019070 [Dionaea muscipula]
MAPLLLPLLVVLFLFTLPQLCPSLASPSSPSSSVHELLKSRGLPAGLLPREVKTYNLDDDGHLEVFLDAPCLTKFENRVQFDSVLRANLSYGELIGVVGLTQEELFIWLPVKGIIVNDPNSGLIVFDIGVAQKQLSVSLFEDPPSCKTQGVVMLGILRAAIVMRRWHYGLPLARNAAHRNNQVTSSMSPTAATHTFDVSNGRDSTQASSSMCQGVNILPVNTDKTLFDT